MLLPMTTLRPVDLDADLDALFALAVACEAAAVGRGRDHPRGHPRAPDLTRRRSGRRHPRGGRRGRPARWGSPRWSTTPRVAGCSPTPTSPRRRPTWSGTCCSTHDTAYAQRQVARRPEESGRSGSSRPAASPMTQRYAAALTRAGLAPVRRFHIMGLAIAAADPPLPPELPGDVTLTVVGDDLGTTADRARPRRRVVLRALAPRAAHLRGLPRADAGTDVRPEPVVVRLRRRRAGRRVPGGRPCGRRPTGRTCPRSACSRRHRGRGLGTLLLRVAFADAAARGGPASSSASTPRTSPAPRRSTRPPG